MPLCGETMVCLIPPLLEFVVIYGLADLEFHLVLYISAS